MKSHHRQALVNALVPLACIPDAYLFRNSEDVPLMQWGDHKIYSRDVMAAREALQAVEAGMPERYGMTITQKEKTA